MPQEKQTCHNLQKLPQHISTNECTTTTNKPSHQEKLISLGNLLVHQATNSHACRRVTNKATLFNPHFVTYTESYWCKMRVSNNSCVHISCPSISLCWHGKQNSRKMRATNKILLKFTLKRWYLPSRISALGLTSIALSSA